MIQNVNKTNKQFTIRTIKITYTGSSSSKENSDLAFSESTDLSFDLYNNSDVQVISYSTSSTGEVTVEESEYATFSVDQTNKKITVTPKTVTPSKQTITVTQAEDDNYYKGTATFSFTVADSTPFEGGDITFDATEDKGSGSINKFPVTLTCSSGTLNNGSEYRFNANSTTTLSTTSGKITKIEFTEANNQYPISNLKPSDGSIKNYVWEGNVTSV